MSDSIAELQHIANVMELWTGRGLQEEIQQPLEKLSEAAKQVEKAWSGSWLGYHANTYYKNFQETPPGEHYSREWGGTSEVWVEFGPEVVKKVIHQFAGTPDMKLAQSFNEEATAEFRTQKSNLLSILEVELAESESPYFFQIKEQLDKLVTQSGQDFVRRWMPNQITSRDRLAHDQGWWTPPHLIVLSEIEAIQHTAYIVERLAELSRQAEAHISRQQRRRPSYKVTGTNVFVGHGHSPIWRELNEFLINRLHLTVEEFDRVSAAGIPITDRLNEMLNSSIFAFLILTGEDEQRTGKIHARMNVIHEAGLFQGRLGFNRAIVLLEENCEEFSNISGLGQIRFQKGNLESVFEKIRMVLEREKILDAN